MNAVATEQELLEFFTCIMRKADDTSQNRMKAAELLGKYAGLFGSQLNDDITVNIQYVEPKGGVNADDEV